MVTVFFILILQCFILVFEDKSTIQEKERIIKVVVGLCKRLTFSWRLLCLAFNSSRMYQIRMFKAQCHCQTRDYRAGACLSDGEESALDTRQTRAGFPGQSCTNTPSSPGHKGFVNTLSCWAEFPPRFTFSFAIYCTLTKCQSSLWLPLKRDYCCFNAFQKGGILTGFLVGFLPLQLLIIIFPAKSKGCFKENSG